MGKYVPQWFAGMMAVSMAIILFGFLRPSAQSMPLVNQYWLDRIPEDPKEAFRAYFFDMEGVGYRIDALSSYRITLEIFEFKDDGQTLDCAFPHDGRRIKTTYTIEPLRPPTRDFDTQLTISVDPNNQNRKSIYYTGPGLGAGLPAQLRRF